jgi:hypothetical protein
MSEWAKINVLAQLLLSRLFIDKVLKEQNSFIDEVKQQMTDTVDNLKNPLNCLNHFSPYNHTLINSNKEGLVEYSKT